MNLYRLGDCLKCSGDLAYDDGDWICLQCGTYYYTGLNSPAPAEAYGSGLLRIPGGETPEDKGDADGHLASAAD